MNRDKALEKALRLVLLSTDPSQVKDGQPSEEARTAAYAACVIIREHRLLGAEDQARSREPSAPPPPDHCPLHPGHVRGLCPVCNAAPPQRKRHREERKKRKPGPWASAWSSSRGAPQAPPPPEATAQGSTEDGKNGGKFMEAKFNGQCLYCGYVIYKGDPIYWMPGFGSDHQACAFQRAGLKVE